MVEYFLVHDIENIINLVTLIICSIQLLSYIYMFSNSNTRILISIGEHWRTYFSFMKVKERIKYFSCNKYPLQILTLNTISCLLSIHCASFFYIAKYWLNMSSASCPLSFLSLFLSFSSSSDLGYKAFVHTFLHPWSRSMTLVVGLFNLPLVLFVSFIGPYK